MDDRRREQNNRWKRANQTRAMFSYARARAEAKGRLFELTFEEVEVMVAPMVCAVTGHALSWDWPVPGQRNPWKPSLDQIRPGEGYVKGNVRIVSYIYNLCKLDWDDEVVAQFRGPAS